MPNGFNPDAFNPHDPGFLADPGPTYALFRAQAPIHRVEQFKSSWLFTYDDCKRVLDDKDVWVKKSPLPATPQDKLPGPYGATSSLPPGLFSSDPKPHTKLRAILEPLLATAIEAAPTIAAEIAKPLLTCAQQHGRIELMSGYALLLPARVLFRLLGIPDDPGVWDGLIAWQTAIVAAHNLPQPNSVLFGGATSSMALNTYFEALRVSYGTAPGNGLFAEMCQTFASKRLRPEQVQACAHDFLVAGYISTTFLIGTGTRNLLRNPEQLAALRKDPTLMDRAIKEMLRFDAPAQLVDRCAAVDTEVGGRPFKAGDRVTAVLGSANHDSNAFENPDEFRITRNPSAHLSFGDGIHRCIGAPLVECVAPVAFDLLLSAFPTLALDGMPQWQTDPYLRAVSSLPLKL